MKRTLRPALVALAIATCAASTATATSRIKDLASIEGIRQNQLIGYGLVVGLNGTGDTLNNTPFTKQSLQGMLERLGVNIRGQQIRTGNVAAVMVTANLPPFATQGTRIDVTASALGDAKSLLGGTLLVTPLLGADGNVYAVAQGSLAIGGFQVQGEAAKITQGVPTVGRLPNGAIIEREIEFSLAALGHLRLSLRNPDFTTAKRIAVAVNDYIGSPVAEAVVASSVIVWLEPSGKVRPKEMLSPALGLEPRLTDICGGEPDGPVAVAPVRLELTLASLKPNGDVSAVSVTAGAVPPIVRRPWLPTPSSACSRSERTCVRPAWAPLPLRMVLAEATDGWFTALPENM